jgi:hypothetical protein
MESIENQFVTLWIDNGVIFGQYKPDVVIDLEAAKSIARDRMRLSNNKDYPSLVYLTLLNTTVTKEARDFFSGGEGIKYMKKLALLTNSPISKMVGNFYLKINQPSIPTRLFTSKEDALKWLKED